MGAFLMQNRDKYQIKLNILKIQYEANHGVHFRLAPPKVI